MSSSGSVTRWVKGLQSGDPEAVQRLWQLYFHQLVALARQKLLGAPRGAADEEDVALSAFDRFCRKAQNGEFPRLEDRHDLWAILVTLTVQKALDLRRREKTKKRRNGRVQAANNIALEQVLSHDPTPDFAAQVAEQCQRLLDLLPSAAFRKIAIAKMEGYTTEEIAQSHRCATRTVERRLELIRKLWRPELAR
jgi:DNA-directed RNA polymerase specialized sigma24 family protein